MRKTYFALLAISLALLSCTDTSNEKAMQAALNKAGITISQKDSIIAAQTYRCNYIVKYVVDTAYLKTNPDGSLVKCNGYRDSMEVPNVGYAVKDTLITLYSQTHYGGRFDRRSSSITKKLKNATLNQLDSTLQKIYSDAKDYRKESVLTADLTKKPYVNKTVTLFKYTYVYSYAITKDYDNLYNVKSAE